MATAAKMWNIKDNPELRDCISLLKRFDKYKLGTMHDGNIVSRNDFLAFIRASAAEPDNLSTEAAVSDGNPAKDNLYDSDGMPSSAFIN